MVAEAQAVAAVLALAVKEMDEAGIRGEMSLVGPRPSLPSEVAGYESDATRRLRVKPGLTGLWQVSGRSDLSWDESLRLDLWYVDNWSLLLDLQITVRTAKAVLRGTGAY